MGFSKTCTFLKDDDDDHMNMHQRQNKRTRATRTILHQQKDSGTLLLKDTLLKRDGHVSSGGV